MEATAERSGPAEELNIKIWNFSMCLSNLTAAPCKGLLLPAFPGVIPMNFPQVQHWKEQTNSSWATSWAAGELRSAEIMKMAHVQEIPIAPHLLYLYSFRIKNCYLACIFLSNKLCIYSKKPFFFQNSKAQKKNKVKPMAIMHILLKKGTESIHI